MRGRDSSSLGSRICKEALGGGGRSVASLIDIDFGAGLVEATCSDCSADDPRLDFDLDLDLDLECDRVKGENVHRRFWKGGLLEKGEEATGGCFRKVDGGGGGKEGDGAGDALAKGEVEGEGDERWMCSRRIKTVASKVSRM